MARLRRYDVGELFPPTWLANGWMRADAIITHTNMFYYHKLATPLTTQHDANYVTQTTSSTQQASHLSQ